MRRVQTRRSHASAKPMAKVRLSDPRTLKERRQHNLQAPVSQLPHEIVVLILSHLKDATITAAAQRKGFGKRGRDLIGASQIYHRWRDIALAASSLWTEIQISTPLDAKWALEMLRRSGQSLLNVQVIFQDITQSALARDTRSTKDINEAVAVIKKNYGRCRELSLFAMHDTLMANFLPTGSDAAHLQSLRLDIISGEHILSDPKGILSDKVLEAKSLRRLSVAHPDVDWNAQFLRHLTHLTLHAGRRWVWSKPPLDGLLRALPEMHALEFLGVGNYFHCLHSQRTDKQLQLPTLKDLRLDLKMHDAGLLLSRLALYSTTNIYLTMKDPNYWNPPYFSSIIDSFTAIFTRGAPSSHSTSQEGHPHSFRLCEGQNEARIQTFREYFSKGFHPSLDCKFRWRSDEDNPIDVVSLFADLPLDHIVELQVIGDFRITAETWVEKFSSIETLQSIFLGDTAALSIIERLIDDMGKSIPQNLHQASPPPFPALTSISISMHKAPVDHLSWSSLMDEWFKYLQHRYNIGHPLQQLILVECPPLLDRQITLFEDVVGQVVESDEMIDYDMMIDGHAGEFLNEFDWV